MKIWHSMFVTRRAARALLEENEELAAELAEERTEVDAANARYDSLNQLCYDRIQSLTLQIANYEKAFERQEEAMRPAPDKSWIEMERG